MNMSVDGNADGRENCRPDYEWHHVNHLADYRHRLTDDDNIPRTSSFNTQKVDDGAIDVMSNDEETTDA